MLRRTLARKVLVAFTLLAALAFAHGQTLVIYPLESPNSLMGTVIADKVAVALEDEFEVYGPAVSPSLVPPLPVGGGFLNPTEYLQGRGVADRVGSALLRDALGAHAVLTGSVFFEDERLVARVQLATREGNEGFLVSAPEEDPGRLATGLVRATLLRLGSEARLPEIELDMSTADGELAQALTLLAAGLGEDALRVLEGMSDPGERARELQATIRAFQEGGEDGDAALLAALALNDQPLDESRALDRFEALSRVSDLPAVRLWVAVLQTSLGDAEGAERTFSRLPEGFEYGRVARSAFLEGEGGSVPTGTLQQALESTDVAALLGVAALAGNRGDTELEKRALERLTRVAPFFPYPFERLSFIAFDEDDPLAAAEALVVAVELEPESDLYWTNLGWAYYLLGMLERSEEASERAISLDPGQYIAQYNLGLVQVVTGRLEQANDTYLRALRADPEVDDAAIEDLENALELYPGEAAVHYALAMMYEAEGRRPEAAEQFALYAQRGENEEFVRRAGERAEELSAPPPPIELTDGLVTVTLGLRGEEDLPFHPGDPLFPSFEVYTPGDELPRALDVGYELRGPDGELVDTIRAEVDVPRSAVALVVDDVELQLPEELSAGTYRLDVSVTASGGRSASGTVMFEVAGQPQLLRQLLGRSVRLQALDTGLMLYGPADIAIADELPGILVDRLRASAPMAEEALPVIEEGRFEGMTGGELFEESSEQDVRDFLRYLLDSGARDTSLVFVEAYAEWALQGAPTEAE